MATCIVSSKAALDIGDFKRGRGRERKNRGGGIERETGEGNSAGEGAMREDREGR
jgi:hypothetical protein